MKTRLDKLLVDRGLAPSRERAQAMIIAGRVLVSEQKMIKPGTNVEIQSEIRLLGEDLRYVSRGGLKLEKALDHWRIALNGKRCMDVGTSTGGFTDCMLQQGAASVLCVDTGYGQIAAKFRVHSRVQLLENTNARYLSREQVEEPVAFIAVDVSFISATLVLPAVIAAGFQEHGGELVLLIKPQFEVGREKIGKGGIVRDEAAQQAAVERLQQSVISLCGTGIEVIDSPILGAEGNREFLLHALWSKM